VVGFDLIVGVLGRVMVHARPQINDRASQRRRPASGDLGGFTMGLDRGQEEPGRSLHVPLLRDVDIDDLPILIHGAVHVRQVPATLT